jgi:hypothetical protein
MATITIGFGNNAREYTCNDNVAAFAEERRKSATMLALGMDKKHEILGAIRSFYAKYQDGTANSDNFYVCTIAEFQPVARRPRRQPDYVSQNRDGKISSEYWYTSDGVIRGSKHWGAGIASCDWFIDDQNTDMKGCKQYGKASWTDFIQKTAIICNEVDGTATMSSFTNTIGGRKQRFGRSVPVLA